MSEGKAKKKCPGCEAMVRTTSWENHVVKCEKVKAGMLPRRLGEKRLRKLLAPEYSRGDFKAPTETRTIGAFGLGKSRKH